MVITRVILKNWRNFRNAEIDLAQVAYLIGPNASGKSNLLDLFRFMRDICKPDGGGLQKAIKSRGGITRLRCLHHRRDPEMRLEFHFSETFDSKSTSWRYLLGFKPEGTGAQRILITTEQVWKDEQQLLNRPTDDELQDPLQLTETHLEQTLANREFREIVDYFTDTTYLHLVPQLLKFGDQIGGNRLDDDPFGQGFLERLARTTSKTRDARLRRIKSALSVAVPQFSDLRFVRDEMGHPHLEAKYEHHRPNAGWQSEVQFSDGTLRLIALLWSLQDGKGVLLLEEPELSLHQAVVEQIPAMIDAVLRQSRNKRQIIVTTHSSTLLNNPGIDPAGVSVLTTGFEGTQVRSVDATEQVGLNAGLTLAEVVLPQTNPLNIEQLVLGLEQ